MILPIYATELYCGIILRNYNRELYDEMISWDYVIELYYKMILQNYITESPCEKEPGDPRNVTRAPGNSWDLRGLPGEAPGPRTDHKTEHLYTNLRGQNLSIAASESIRCTASPQNLPLTILWSFLNDSFSTLA